MANQIIIPVLAFLAVVLLGGSVLISRLQKRKIVEARLQETAEAGKVKTRPGKGLVQFLQKVGNLVSHGQPSTTLYEQLARAGFMNTTAPALYAGTKMLLFGIGLGVVGVAVIPLKMPLLPKLTLILIAGTVLFFIPNLIVSMLAKKRHDEVYRHLPEAIDLLEICVSSGIGLDMAWNIVADEIQHVSSVLANSMALTNFEIHLGAGRAEAMRHMAKRTAVDELSSLAALLVQSERFGTSIAETLRIFAASMREERSFTIEEDAEKMAVKLILPMVLFIFPAVLITAAGPAAITLARELIFS